MASQVDDVRLVPHAVAILFCLPGVPSVYYGDERGLLGIKEERFGGDDAIRPQFPATPGELEPAEDSVYRAYRTMISIRRRHPWLVNAYAETTALANEQLVIRVTERAGSGDLLVALNLSDQEAGPDLPAGDWSVLESSDPVDPDRPNVLAPYGWTVLVPSS